MKMCDMLARPKYNVYFARTLDVDFPIQHPVTLFSTIPNRKSTGVMKVK